MASTCDMVSWRTTRWSNTGHSADAACRLLDLAGLERWAAAALRAGSAGDDVGGLHHHLAPAEQVRDDVLRIPTRAHGALAEMRSTHVKAANQDKHRGRWARVAGGACSAANSNHSMSQLAPSAGARWPARASRQTRRGTPARRGWSAARGPPAQTERETSPRAARPRMAR